MVATKKKLKVLFRFLSKIYNLRLIQAILNSAVYKKLNNKLVRNERVLLLTITVTVYYPFAAPLQSRLLGMNKPQPFR